MTKKVAFLFPGQGSQAVGMGKDLYETSESAKQVFDTADEVLGKSITTMCFEGPEEALKQIEEKGYAAPFANDPRQLLKAGVNFSSKTRNIDCWVVD